MVSDLVVVQILLVTLGIVGGYAGLKRRRIHVQMADVTPTPVGDSPLPVSSN
jgi:hypothetical protein